MRMNRKMILAFACMALLVGGPIYAFKILNEDKDPSKVVNTLSLKDSPWRSKTMKHPEKVILNRDREWSGKDFFIDEFGFPCDFSNPKADEIKKVMRFDSRGKHEFKDGKLEFTSGKKGFWFAFGPEPMNLENPGLRFGSKWGKNQKDRYRIRMTISQNVPESEWVVTPFGYFGIYKKYRRKPFFIKGEKEQVVEWDAGYVRQLFSSRHGQCGFRIDCMTPNASVKIKDIKIAPCSATAYFRKKFKINEKPVIAHATYDSPETYKLYINGKLVDEGNHTYPKGSTKTLDLLPYLKKGENTIAFGKQFLGWTNNYAPEAIFEGVAIGKDGKITRVICPEGWKSSLKYKKDWMSPNFDDSAWKTPKEYEKGLHQVMTSWGSDNKNYWTGVEPKHMGMLQVEPFGQKYPVWNYKDEVAFSLKLPSGVKEKMTPRLKIYKAQTQDLVKTVSAPKANEKDGLNEYVFKIQGLETGPYRLEWELCDKAGKVLEMNRQELIVAGPIEQDKLGLAEFEEEFQKRLELVRKIDCSEKIEIGEEFCDHAGMYSVAKTGRGRVFEADGMKYRETGKNAWDWFSYRLHDLELGMPYLAEVIVPDNRDRYIYTAIIDQWPLGFNCNYSTGEWPDHTATGGCVTGVDQPLSMKPRKIRFVFWPSSKCSSITVMSGFRGFPAAACEINIFKINGDLPALKMPASNRMFGSHNERISVMSLTTGISENPLMGSNNRRKNGLRDGWLNWYRALERKIKWMKFHGRNMTSEGVYMYMRGDYPSLKHNRSISNQELDPPLLAIKMYQQNKINCFLSVEYQSSAEIWKNEKLHISNREMWRNPDSSIYQVDKHGRQVVANASAGVNFIHPKGEALILDLVGEIYDFYQDAGKVAGLFMVVGGWWQPSFSTASFKDIVSTDVGYGDFTVGLFEKECGVKLGVDPKDPKRFMKRFEKLMGEHKPLWLYWRAKKTQAMLLKIEKLINSGKTNWPLYVYSTFNRCKPIPFLEAGVQRSERDQYYEQCFTESGIPWELYRNNPNIRLVAPARNWGKFRSPHENWMYCKGMTNNRGTREIVKKLDAVFFHIHKGLDEVDQPAGAADKWIWSKTGRGVFLPRWAGDYAMAEYVNVLAWTTPKIVFYGWLDCNMDTGTGEAIRRFSKSFLVTPEVEFKTLPGENVKGVIAESAQKDGKTYLRLVNNSPWISKGIFQAKASKVTDLVYDRDLSSSFMSGGKYSIEMKPYDIRLFELIGADNEIKCQFSLPEKVRKDIFAKTEYVLNDPLSLETIPGDLIALMFKALQEKDAFALRCLMDDFEAKAAIINAEKNRKSVENQKKFLSDLEKGRGRIICASQTEYKAPDGSRWLPDQKFTGCGAYGNTGGNYVERAGLEIEGTNLDKVYQTEAYGSIVTYKIPIPKGDYNVYLHFSETFINNKAPGMRRIGVEVESRKHPEKVDPFKNANGWAKAYVLEMKDIPAYDGILDIELTGAVQINGIEIEKAK